MVSKATLDGIVGTKSEGKERIVFGKYMAILTQQNVGNQPSHSRLFYMQKIKHTTIVRYTRAK